MVTSQATRESGNLIRDRFLNNQPTFSFFFTVIVLSFQSEEKDGHYAEGQAKGSTLLCHLCRSHTEEELDRLLVQYEGGGGLSRLESGLISV